MPSAPDQIFARVIRTLVQQSVTVRQFKLVIEKHLDGYVAYPVGVKDAVVGQGDTYEEALADVRSAIACYVEVFGLELLEDTAPEEIFVAETGIAV